jgi:hypothetical protein
MFFWIILGFLSVGIALSLSNHAFAQQTNFLTHGKSIFGLSIKYPDSWVVDEYDRTTPEGRIGFDIFAYFCPKSEGELSFDEVTYDCNGDTEVLVSINHIPANMSLNEFFTSEIGNYKLEFTDFKIVNSSSAILDGNSAKKVIYTLNAQDNILKKLEFFVVKDNIGYRVSYSAPELEFDDNLKIAQDMINSLKISKMPPCKLGEAESEILRKCEL